LSKEKREVAPDPTYTITRIITRIKSDQTRPEHQNRRCKKSLHRSKPVENTMEKCKKNKRFNCGGQEMKIMAGRMLTLVDWSLKNT